MKKTLIVSSLLACFLVGCVSDQAHRIYVSENTYPSKNPVDVEILYKKPSKDFIVIADLQARGNAVDEFRSIAAKIGADAVIISYLGGDVVNAQWAGKDEGSTYNRMVGSVIKYKEEK